jgi:3-oxoacyl-[acyl-carrier protein] reductase
MDLGLQGKIAIVTGGSQGIGQAVAAGLVREGSCVTICARDGARLERAAKEIDETGHAVLAVPGDMGNPIDIARVVDATIRRFGGVDILVNNAGRSRTGHFPEVDEAGLQASVDVKLFGFMRMARAVLPHMRRRGAGRIINMVGGAGKQPNAWMIGSATINGALLSFTKALSEELGQDNILVNAVLPGYIDTPQWHWLKHDLAKDMNLPPDEAMKVICHNTALRRFGSAEEIANVIIFLASARASYVTGVAIQVDGGRIKSAV